jgi:hypothetical protein
MIARRMGRAGVRRSHSPAKANLAIDASLLQAIDEAAEPHGPTCSAFLASAAREKMANEG